MKSVPITLAGARVGTAVLDGHKVAVVVLASRVLANALLLDTTRGLALDIVSGAPACPECTAGKHQNCTGDSWDPVADEPAGCPCAEVGHVADPA